MAEQAGPQIVQPAAIGLDWIVEHGGPAVQALLDHPVAGAEMPLRDAGPARLRRKAGAGCGIAAPGVGIAESKDDFHVRPPKAAAARANATKPETSISSARAVGASPAASISAATSMWRAAAKPFSDCRSILRRWPNAACAAADSSAASHGSGAVRGMSSTTLDVTLGGGVNAAGET